MIKCLSFSAIVLVAVLTPSLTQANDEGCSIAQDGMASKELESATNLFGIYDTSKAFPGCLKGGGISEEVSNDVVGQISHHWDGSLREMRRRGANPEFLSFVLRHIDATTSADDLHTILRNAKFLCPQKMRSTCSRIAAAATAALRD
jgi:hypothetical protein